MFKNEIKKNFRYLETENESYLIFCIANIEDDHIFSRCFQKIS